VGGVGVGDGLMGLVSGEERKWIWL
jgi:hypothetical protein